MLIWVIHRTYKDSDSWFQLVSTLRPSASACRHFSYRPRPGLSGAPASIMLPLAALVSPHRTWHDQVDVVSYAAKFMGLSETGGRGGVGVI